MIREAKLKQVPAKYTDWRCTLCGRLLHPGELHVRATHYANGDYEMFGECGDCTDLETMERKPGTPARPGMRNRAKVTLQLNLFAEATR